MNHLRALLPSIRPLLDENFRSGDLSSIDASQHTIETGWNRQVDIDPLLAVVDEAMRRFRHAADQSDSWLAPRVHASLRLTRRGAGDRRIWYWLNIAAKPDYVRWRFRNERNDSTVVPVDRFMGEDSKNALGRLWWAAELTRNGCNYSETASILQTSRFFTSWQPLDAMHHRAAAIAVCRFARTFNEGKGMTDSQSQRLAKAFNLRLTTLGLDTLARNRAVDTDAIEEWSSEPVDETKYMDEMPVGPDEEPLGDEEIHRVSAVLEILANEIDLADFKRPSRKQEQAADDVVDAGLESAALS